MPFFFLWVRGRAPWPPVGPSLCVHHIDWRSRFTFWSLDRCGAFLAQNGYNDADPVPHVTDCLRSHTRFFFLLSHLICVTEHVIAFGFACMFIYIYMENVSDIKKSRNYCHNLSNNKLWMMNVKLWVYISITHNSPYKFFISLKLPYIYNVWIRGNKEIGDRVFYTTI